MSFPTVTSVDRTTDGQIMTGPGGMVSVNICAGADAATVTIYDNTSAAGDVLCKLGVGIGLSASFTPALPISCGTGLYADLTGTTPQVVVSYI